MSADVDFPDVVKGEAGVAASPVPGIGEVGTSTVTGEQALACDEMRGVALETDVSEARLDTGA